MYHIVDGVVVALLHPLGVTLGVVQLTNELAFPLGLQVSDLGLIESQLILQGVDRLGRGGRSANDRHVGWSQCVKGIRDRACRAGVCAKGRVRREC